MICNRCKQQLPDDSEFCHLCGNKIEKVVPAPAHTVKKPKKDKKPLIIGLLSAIVVALIVCVVVLLVGNKNGQTPDNQTTYNVGVRTITFSDKFTAEYALASWENGEKTEQSMIDIMDEYGAEQGGGKLYIITSGEFVEEIDEWCFSEKRKQGDYAIIENSYGFSLCYFSGKNIEENNTSNNKNNSNADTLKVAIEADFVPYSWSENGEYCGLHVDIAKEIAKRTGKTVSFVVVDFHDMISGVDSGLYDMAFGLEKTPERAELVTFTDEYYDGMYAIYHTKDEKPSFSEWTEYTKTLQEIKEDGTLDTLLSKYNLS